MGKLAFSRYQRPVAAMAVKRKASRNPAPGSAHRVLTYDPASDEAIWEGTVVRRGDPIPE